jgi:hypothetical protein
MRPGQGRHRQHARGTAAPRARPAASAKATPAVAMATVRQVLARHQGQEVRCDSAGGRKLARKLRRSHLRRVGLEEAPPGRQLGGHAPAASSTGAGPWRSRRGGPRQGGGSRRGGGGRGEAARPRWHGGAGRGQASAAMHGGRRRGRGGRCGRARRPGTGGRGGAPCSSCLVLRAEGAEPARARRWAAGQVEGELGPPRRPTVRGKCASARSTWCSVASERGAALARSRPTRAADGLARRARGASADSGASTSQHAGRATAARAPGPRAGARRRTGGPTRSKSLSARSKRCSAA